MDDPNIPQKPTKDHEKISLWIPFLLILCILVILTVIIICSQEIRRACNKAVENRIGK